MSPDRQALLSLYHDDATALLDRALQAQLEPEGLHVAHAALVEALADAHTDGREPGVSTTVPDETIAAIEARRNAAREWLASDHTAPHVWPEGASHDGGERCLRCGSTVPAGVCLSSRTMQFLDARGLLRDANDDLRTLLTEVRRLTDALATSENERAVAVDAFHRCRQERDQYKQAAETWQACAEIDRIASLDPAAVVGSGS